MGVKAFFAKRFAAIAARKIQRWANDPLKTQQKVFAALIQGAKDTKFGRDHNFSKINSHEDFVAKVPIRDYEALRPYVDQMVGGESDVLWPGKPLYYAKTSGTTSGSVRR